MLANKKASVFSLQYPNDDWAFANPDDLALDNIIDDQHNFEDNSLDQEQPISSAKRNATTIDPSLPRLGKDKRILTLKDLLNAYILTRARLRLAQACWEQGMLRAGVFTPDEVVRGLLSVALYDVSLCQGESKKVMQNLPHFWLINLG